MNARNKLGTEPIPKLLTSFTIPSIVAMLVSSLYNIIDQYFIGQYVGSLGNAATNIAFPLTITCTAIALLCGIGGASAFNLSMGEGNKEKALHYIGNGIMLMVVLGIALCVISELLLEPMLLFFGSPLDVLEYAKTYTKITAIGFPFLILTSGGGHLIRADGSPRISMLCNLTGAIINVFLDALFVKVLGYGMAGAAVATIIGQMISATMAIVYLAHFKTGKLTRKNLVLERQYVGRLVSLGAAPCSNQLSMMVVQIVLNKSLKYYGSLSEYGEAIPIACAGIISKVNMVFQSFVIGTSQGLQPIASFNYGAKQYHRVRKAYLIAISAGFCMCLIAFALFQLCPRQIISLFGDGDELYYSFAVNYFRIYLFFTFINFLQPITSNFFTAIGKPQRGVFLALTRQIIFLLPMILILPLFMKIDGIMYAGPVADFIAVVVTAVMIIFELKKPQYWG